MLAQQQTLRELPPLPLVGEGWGEGGNFLNESIEQAGFSLKP